MTIKKYLGLVREAQKLQSEMAKILVFAAHFDGRSYAEFLTSQIDSEQTQAAMNKATDFINKMHTVKPLKAEEVEIGGVTYYVDFVPASMTVAQWMDIESISTVPEWMDRVLPAIAVCLTKEKGAEYTSSRAEQTKLIEDMPAELAMGLAAFFLTRSKGLEADLMTSIHKVEAELAH